MRHRETKMPKEIVVSEKNNPFLADHVINGSAVLPATCALSMMINSIEPRDADRKCSVINNFEVNKGVVFKNDDAIALEVASDSALKQGNGTVDEVENLTIASFFKKFRIVNYKCEAVFNTPETLYLEELKCTSVFEGSQLPPIYKDSYGYGLLFSGPTFQGIKEILEITENSMVTKCNLAKLQNNHGQFPVNGSTFDPYIADVFLQCPYLWLVLKTEYAGLPSAIEKLEMVHAIPYATDFYVRLDILQRTSLYLYSDITAYDLEGKVYCRLSGVKFTVSKKLKTALVSPQTIDSCFFTITKTN